MCVSLSVSVCRSAVLREFECIAEVQVVVCKSSSRYVCVFECVSVPKCCVWMRV